MAETRTCFDYLPCTLFLHFPVLFMTYPHVNQGAPHRQQIKITRQEEGRAPAVCFTQGIMHACTSRRTCKFCVLAKKTKQNTSNAACFF